MALGPELAAVEKGEPGTVVSAPEVESIANPETVFAVVLAA
jgi:hypothetical protein